jgi:hypothetical protein
MKKSTCDKRRSSNQRLAAAVSNYSLVDRPFGFYQAVTKISLCETPHTGGCARYANDRQLMMMTAFL